MKQTKQGRDKLFILEMIPEVEYTSKTTKIISDILSFWSTLYLKFWWRFRNYKIWPALWTADVIGDVMSSWNITCTAKRQLCACKILSVWHQSFIVKSSGQTSWQTQTDIQAGRQTDRQIDRQTHTHTNKQTNTPGLKTLSPRYRVITSGMSPLLHAWTSTAVLLNRRWS